MSAEKTTTTVEVWVLVDAIGDAEVGTSEDEVSERWESNIGTHNGARRLMRIKLVVPLPKPQELTAVVPADDAAPAELQVA